MEVYEGYCLASFYKKKHELDEEFYHMTIKTVLMYKINVVKIFWFWDEEIWASDILYLISSIHY